MTEFEDELARFQAAASRLAIEIQRAVNGHEPAFRYLIAETIDRLQKHLTLSLRFGAILEAPTTWVNQEDIDGK